MLLTQLEDMTMRFYLIDHDCIGYSSTHALLDKATALAKVIESMGDACPYTVTVRKTGAASYCAVNHSDIPLLMAFDIINQDREVMVPCMVLEMEYEGAILDFYAILGA